MFIYFFISLKNFMHYMIHGRKTFSPINNDLFKTNDCSTHITSQLPYTNYLVFNRGCMPTTRCQLPYKDYSCQPKTENCLSKVNIFLPKE